MKVVGMDHIVLRVADVERSLAWYRDELGLQPERVDEWRDGKILFPSVRVDATTVIDLLAAPRGDGEPNRDSINRDSINRDSINRDSINMDHVCLVIEPEDLDALAASGRFDVVAGPSRLWGAQGDGTGLYVHDPDGNLVELRHYA
jgi:catechol 2,3-dioxygenase-like lactoylglutathione lyase family enzyme